MECSAALSTANIADVSDGEWAAIAPYGDHPSPDATYIQHFDRPQAEKLIRTWNSLTGTAARIFKNLWHGLGPGGAIPVWDGHPETDRRRWPSEKLLASISELRAGKDALEGRVTWNRKGAAARTRGPLYPSPLWWHWPPTGTPPTVYPELLESVGLVPTPNISSVPAWTQNSPTARDLIPASIDPATPLSEQPICADSGAQPFASDTQADNQPAMTNEQFMALRYALGLPETADAAACISAAQSATAVAQQLTEREAALATANTAWTALEDQLTEANSQAAALTFERDQLQTANAGLTTEIETLRAGLLDLAEGKGSIAPAEREAFLTRLTANAATTVGELRGRSALNTQPVEINGNRVDLSTANARQGALHAAVQRRMKEESLGYEEAFFRCSQDPALKGLFDAMQQPTQAA